MKNTLKMVLKLWGSGMASLVVLTVSVLPLSVFDGDSVGYLLALLPIVGVLAPILTGATQYWFWKDHDWHGTSK